MLTPAAARRTALLTAVLCWSPAGQQAAAQEVVYTGAVQFATGKYLFETRTDSFYLLSGLDVSSGPLRVSASIPVIVQSTPWIAYGPVPLPSGGRAAGEVMRQTGRGQRRIVLPETGFETSTAIGDPLLRADVAVVRDAPFRPSIRIGAGAKPPLAGVDDGVGTGRWDYGAGVSVGKVAGPHSVSAEVSYWHFGDLDELVLRNAWSYGAGYGRALGSGRRSLLVSGSAFSTVIDGQEPPVQVGIGLGRAFGSDRAVAGTVSFGVTNTAPDVSVGVGWRIGLSSRAPGRGLSRPGLHAPACVRPPVGRSPRSRARPTPARGR